MAGIFINYRRADSIAYTGHLYTVLQQHFPQEHIFMDIDTLKPGENFVKAIQKTVASCDALVAVIGKQWLTAQDGKGQRRLEDSEDFVRLEIEAALERGILVIPALVGGAQMPSPSALPDSLKKLTQLHAVHLTDVGFRQSVNSLIEVLEPAVKTPLITKKYKELSGPERTLIADRAAYWEHRLFSEALLREFSRCADLKRDWTQNRAFASHSMRCLELIRYMQEKNSSLQSILNQLQELFQVAFPKAVGPPGNVDEIIYVANRIGATYQAALEWKLDYYRLILEPRLLKLRSLAASMFDDAVKRIEGIPEEISRELSACLKAPPSSAMRINIVVEFTIPDLSELDQELDRIVKAGCN